MNQLFKIMSVITILVFLRTGFASAAEEVFFYYTDPAGTPVAMSQSGEVVWKSDYMPFGEEIIDASTVQNNKLFVGKEKDSETGLHYFGARYMASTHGRFISSDSIGAVNPNTGEINQLILRDPQRSNLYAYGINNPYKFVDEDGNWAQIIIPALIFLLSSAHPANAPGPTEATIPNPTATEELVNAGISLGAGYGAGKIIGSVGKTAEIAWPKLSGMLRDAAKGKGNFGIGSATREEAEIMGKAWVGEGATVSESGNALVSADRLRIFRIGYKRRLERTQANFEQKIESQKTKQVISNAHLDIVE